MGETSPKIAGRFNSPNMANTYTNKKYSGTTKGPMSNSGSRNSQARQRLLASKISAPRPINLPSLRRENASGVEIVSSPGSSHIWGSLSPSFNRSELDSTDPSTRLSPAANTETQRAWTSASITQSKLKSVPTKTSGESVSKKETPLEEIKDKSRSKDLEINNQSWDEMVSEDLDDFSVNVMEFSDGTKFAVDVEEPVETYRQHEEHVNGSEKQQSNMPENQNNRSTAEKQTYRPTYDKQNNHHTFEKQNKHYVSEKWQTSDNKRSTFERKSDTYQIKGAFHPTPPLNQPRQSSEYSFKSNHSREEEVHDITEHDNTVEHSNVAPKHVMLTAVERAKKRRDEQETEYRAAEERARQKAAVLAAQTEKRKEDVDDNLTKPSIVEPMTDNKKPWSMVAAKVDDVVTNESSADKSPQESNTNTGNRVEVVDFSQHEDLGTIPERILYGRNRERGWIRSEENSTVRGRGRGAISARGRGRGRKNSTDHWRQHEEPVIIEILKHEPAKEEPKEEHVLYRDRIDDLLKKSTSPLLPQSVATLLVKKPANLSFMVEADESDAEITKEYTEETVEEEEFNESDDISTPADENTSIIDSASSTHSGVYINQGGIHGNGLDPNRANVSPNYPLFVYQYPIAQQSTSEETRHTGYPSQPMGVYLMHQQQYVANNQYMVPYPPAGSASALYYPAVSWQQPQHYSPRPHYKPRRAYHNNNNEWQSYHYNNPRNSFHTRPYRGRGGANSHRRYYPAQEASFDSPPPTSLKNDTTDE